MKGYTNFKLRNTLPKYEGGNEVPEWGGTGYAQGAGAMAGLVGGAIQDFSSPTDSGSQIGGGVLSGMGSGAAMGAFAGPIGIGVGALAGGIYGGVTGKMKADEAMKAKLGLNRSRGMANNMSYNTTNYDQIMAKGGMITNPFANAELERGEPYRTPDGRIDKVSDKGATHEQGGEPMYLEPGTEILGKNKILGKQFKELGSQLKKVQDSSDKVLNTKSTMLAKTTATHNLKNINKKWSALFSVQQQNKGMENPQMMRKGGLITKYATKDSVNVIENRNGNIDEGYAYKMNPDSTESYKYFYNQPDSTFEMEVGNNSYDAMSATTNDQSARYYSPDNTPLPMDARIRTNKAINRLKNSKPGKYSKGGKLPMYAEPNASNNFNMRVGNEDVSWLQTAMKDPNFLTNFAKEGIGIDGKKLSRNPKDLGIYANQLLTGKNDYIGVGNDYASYPAMKNYYNSKVKSTVTRNPNTVGMKPMNYRVASNNNIGLQGVDGVSMTNRDINTANLKNNLVNTGNGNVNTGWNSSDNIAMAANAIPALYNMGRGLFGKADKVNAANYQNPYEQEALGALKNNKFDIDPLLYSIKESNRMADYNAKNYGGSKGELLNRMQGNALNRNRSVAEAYTLKYNNEAPGIDRYAQAALGLGANKANMNWQADMYNRQSQATKDNLFAQGLSQGTQGVMDYMKYKNQGENDRLRIQALNQGMRNYKYDPEKGLKLGV